MPGFDIPGFDMPRFDMPGFDMPGFDMSGDHMIIMPTGRDINTLLRRAEMHGKQQSIMLSAVLQHTPPRGVACATAKNDRR